MKKICLLFLAPLSLLALPTTPSNLQLTALSATSVEISWQSNAMDNKGYKIFRDGLLVKRITDNNITTFVDGGLSANTTYTYEVKATDDETPETVANIVDRHNYYRSLEFTDSPISWDETLANHAQSWAEYLAAHYTQADAGSSPHASAFQTDNHNEDDYQEGENIAWSSATMPYYTDTPVDISDVAVADAFPHGAVDAWASEKAYYDYTTNSQKSGYESKAIGHYTQLVWQKSTKIGCAKAASTTDYPGEWVVCRYAIAGNMYGEKPYCSNYTVSDLYSDGNYAFTTSMIEGKTFSITKVLEDRAACIRRDIADSALSFTGTSSASIPQYNTFNKEDNSNLWDMNFDIVTIEPDGTLSLSNEANDRYMTLKIIADTPTYYSVEAYWWVLSDTYERRAILKLAK